MAVGNIVGSNIFNLLAVLGVTALFKEIEIMNPAILSFDYLFMIVLTIIFGALIYMFNRGKLDKTKGAFLLLIYFGYIYISLIS